MRKNYRKENNPWKLSYNSVCVISVFHDGIEKFRLFGAAHQKNGLPKLTGTSRKNKRLIRRLAKLTKNHIKNIDDWYLK